MKTFIKCAILTRAQDQETEKQTDKSKPRKTAQPDSLDAAVQFCEGVGGVDAAKTLLETIERIKKL